MKAERTPEERKLFYEERLSVLNALREVQDYDPEEDEDANKKAMMGLVDSLDGCDKLIEICGNLAGLAVRQGEIRMGPEQDAPQTAVTLRDMRVLGAALHKLLKDTEAVGPKTADGKAEQTPAVIRVRRAASRVTPVRLFYVVRYGGVYRYAEKTPGKNNVPIITQRERYFAPIPEHMLPLKPIARKRGNLTEIVSVIDFGMYPESAQRIYKILVELEKDQPEVKLPVRPGSKVTSRTVSRVGGAKFFLDHLPRGLKPWAQPKADETAAIQ